VTTLADPAALLAAWEVAAAVPPVARGAVLLHRAGLAPDLDTALDLDVGECAARALRAHLAAFGPDLDGLTTCPSCTEPIEVQVRLPDSGPIGDARAVDHVGALTVRPPSTRDLLAAGGAADAAGELVARCVRNADGGAVVAAELDPAELAALDEAAERLAGLAATTVATRCPACGADVEIALDLGAALWDRVDAAAPAVLAQVAQLASAFGWSEAAVLGMSAARRRAYLALVTG
jgi:hypothetical protein